MSRQSEFTKYRSLFPYVGSYCASHFGEDPDIFGDSIVEVIQDVVLTRSMKSKTGAIQELQTLLSFDDITLTKATWALIAFDPTANIEDYRPGWGFYPSLRAFWTDVLHALETDPRRINGT